MDMQKAMAALSSGQVVDTTAFDRAKAPDTGGVGGATTPKERPERQVSLG